MKIKMEREYKKKEEHDFHDSQKQGITKLMACAFEDPTGMGFLILYQIIQWLRAKLGDKPLIDFWKQDYEKNIKRLNLLGVYCSNLNFYLIPYKTQENIKLLLKEDVNSERFNNYRLNLARASQHFKIMFEAYISLLSSSTLANADIDNSMWSGFDKLKEKMGGMI